MKNTIAKLTVRAAFTAALLISSATAHAALVYPTSAPNGDGISLPDTVSALTSFSPSVDFHIDPVVGGGTFVPGFSFWVTGSTYLNEGTTATIAPVLQLSINGGAWTNLLTLEAFSATDTNDANDRPNSASPAYYFHPTGDPDAPEIDYQYNLPELAASVPASGGDYSYRLAVTATNTPDASFEVYLTGTMSQAALDLQQYDAPLVTGTFTATVPEPTSSILLLSSVALLSRRRRQA